ncbi:MAG: radical SAM protein [Magnetococcales bacterium]|nr:radical SAM protein [Magnetococcales bacterium]
MINNPLEPGYLTLLAAGALASRVEAAKALLADCRLCARVCGVDRFHATRGAVCQTGVVPVVASYNAHFGEEDPLRGRGGSGTIFFSHCNLRCVFCQNWELSWQGEGAPMPPERLAKVMLLLQSRGCHNINLVSPTHVLPAILEAVWLAAREGLRLPLVYNTGGYDSLESLALLDGVVDIYMPDMKYGDPHLARRFSRVRDYPRINQIAVREMHRQVGDLTLDDRGVATRGLLVRHLVLPGGVAGSREVLDFLAREISLDTYLNIMDQYRPLFRAGRFPPLDRGEVSGEYRQALAYAGALGFTRLDQPKTGWGLFSR